MSQPVNLNNSETDLVPVGTGCYGYVAVTSAVVLKDATPDGGALTALTNTKKVQVRIVTGGARVRFDGTNPTTTVGEPLPIGLYTMSREQYNNLRIVQDGTDTPTVHVHQYKTK